MSSKSKKQTLRNLAAALLASLSISLAAPAFAADPDHSLRLGTFNTWLKPDEGILIPAMPNFGMPGFYCPAGVFVPPAHCEVGFHPHFDEQQIDFGAQAFADRIIASGYDVIALNEVFDGSAQTIMQSALLPHYPYAISYLDEWSSPDQDSGLAIYSKFPFVQINTAFKTHGDYDDVQARTFINGQLESDENVYRDFVTYRSFGSACELGDCWSNKGIGYVAVKNPETDRVHHVFFTHLQATYIDEIEGNFGPWQGTQYRETQMQMMKDMIELARTQNPGMILDRDDIFVVGDLNIEGDLSNTEDDMSQIAQPWNNKGEWTKYFNSNQFNNGYFMTKLEDTWVTHHVIRDTLPTQANDDWGNTHSDYDCLSDSDGNQVGHSERGCRWDYILHNGTAQSTKFCNQHSTLAHNLYYGAPYVASANQKGGRGNSSDGLNGTTNSANFHSDHIGRNANYNQMFEQCSPLSPASAQAVYGAHPTAGKSFGAKALTPTDLGNNADGSVNFSNPGTLKNGTLQFPGSVQWWTIDQAGSYLLGFHDDLVDADVDTSEELGYELQVFQSGDLSTPVKNYKSEEWSVTIKTARGTDTTITGEKFILTDPPYYIKIYHPNQQHKTIPLNANGTYAFGAHRLNCTNKTSESCPIYPNMKMSNYKFPANMIVQSAPNLDSLYFNLHVQQLTIPGTQRLDFIVSDYTLDRVQSQLTDGTANSDPMVCGDGTSTTPCNNKINNGYNLAFAQNGITTGSSGIGTNCPAGTGTMGESQFSGCNNLIKWNAIPQPQNATRELFWRVRRNMSSAEIKFAVTWRTDLTVFYGSEFGGKTIDLQCEVETNDGSPSDEINMRVNVDGVQVGPGLPNGFVISDDYDQDIEKSIDGQLDWHVGLPIKFKNEIEMFLIEYDPADNEEDSNDIDVLNRQVLGPMSAETREDETFYVDGGKYELKLNLSHGTQAYEPKD